MNNVLPESLEQIGMFRVTSRESETILKQSGITKEDIENLPPKATVMEIGSGMFQELGKHFKSVREDIRFISVDPTLGLREEDSKNLGTNYFENERKSALFTPEIDMEDTKQIVYRLKEQYPDSEKEILEKALEIHKERIKNAKETGGIAALAPALPFAANKIDMVVDSFGPGTWFCGDSSEGKMYLTEITRLLKPEGTAVIFPIESVMDFVTQPEDKKRHALTRRRIEPILEQIPGIETEFYEEDVTVGEETSKRLGLKIRKKEILKEETRIEKAEASISFNIEESLRKIIEPDTDLIVIGETHPNIELEGKDTRISQDVVKIIENLMELGITPNFVGIELSLLDEEKLNEAGKIYLRSNKPLIEYCDEKGINLVPVAGNYNLEGDSQEFENSVADRIQNAKTLNAGLGLVILGNFHARKTKTKGKANILPATAVLRDRGYKTKSILHHTINTAEPGVEIIEEANKIAAQSNTFVDLYPQKKENLRGFEDYTKEDCDLIILSPSVGHSSLQRW